MTSSILKLLGINNPYINNNLAIGNKSSASCVEGIIPWPWNLGWVTQDHWKRNHWIDHIRLTVLLVEIFDVEYYRDLEMLVTGHSTSLKMVQFESQSTISYSPSIVTMAVSLAIWEIFSVKEWPDLEIWVCGRSRSLKMARFDRPCMTFYQSAIV